MFGYHFVFCLCPVVCQFSKNGPFFFEKRVQKFGFSNFCVLSLYLENYLFKGLLKHYKNIGFSQFLSFVLLKEKKEAKKR